MTTATEGPNVRRYDHPAQILRTTAATSGPIARGAFDAAAHFLEQYEETNSVSFETLDAEALAEVQTAYDALTSTARDSDVYGYKTREFADAVRDLLGLEA